MTPDLRFHPEARAELVAAQDHYEAQRPGLGRTFHAALSACLTTILDQPLAGTEVAPAVRWRLITRFPYAVLYSVQPEDVLVLAVMHLRRRPGYWTARQVSDTGDLGCLAGPP